MKKKKIRAVFEEKSFRSQVIGLANPMLRHFADDKAKQKNLRNPPSPKGARASEAKRAQAGNRSGLLDQNLYVSLPPKVISDEMLAGRIAIESLKMTMLRADGESHVVSLSQNPKIHLYALDKPLEKIQVDYMSQRNEILVLRNRLMLMAMRLGLGDEVPSTTTFTTWPQLADKIVDRIRPSSIESPPFVMLIEKLFKDSPHTRRELLSLVERIMGKPAVPGGDVH